MFAIRGARRYTPRRVLDHGRRQRAPTDTRITRKRISRWKATRWDVIVERSYQVFAREQSMIHLIGESDKTKVPPVKGTNTSVPVAGVEGSGVGVEGESAAVVDRWFGTYGFGWTSPADLKTRLDSQKALQDPYFHYIANNIRLG
jgi:hypothetical protein